MSNIDNIDELILNDSWNLYFHAKNNLKKYADNTTLIYNISSIKSLWEVYNNFPQPLELFSEYNTFQKKIKKTNEIPNAISIFRNNSYPQWEHNTNKNGYEWSMRKQKNIQDSNYIWLNLILTILGEAFENSELINGIRIVDCSIESKIIYRYEVWISEKKYKEYFENLIKNILKTPNYIRLIYRDHCTLKETEKI
jgi:hypothetical protein